MNSFDKAVEYEIDVARSTLSSSLGLAVPLCGPVVKLWRTLVAAPLGFWCLPPPYDNEGSELHLTLDSPETFRFWKNSHNQDALPEWVEQFGILQGNDAFLVDAEGNYALLTTIFTDAFKDQSHFSEMIRVWKTVEKATANGSLYWVGVPVGTDSECLCLITHPGYKGWLIELSNYCSKNNLPIIWFTAGK